MRSLRRSLPALTGLLFAGVLVVGGVSPALAAVPFTSSQGTALVSGSPLIQANCPTTDPVASGPATTSTNGPATVTNAGAQCSGGSARTSGVYAIAGNTARVGQSTLRFDAACTSGGSTNGFIDVPAGTSVNGVVVTQPTPVTTPNAAIIFPGGATGTANVTSGSTATSISFSALILSTGQVIGRVACGSNPYPLAVDAPSVGAATPDIALAPVGSDSGNSSSNRMLYVGGALALLILAQVTVGRSMWRRRRGVTGS